MVYMDFLAEYNRKKRTPEEAVSVVKSGDWVDYWLPAGTSFTMSKYGVICVLAPSRR